jgi:hypothetical protein
MSKYKLIQLTNNSIGAIEAGAMMPLGLITRKINASTTPCSTFQVASTDSDVIYINEPGFYKITYTATLTAGAAGALGVTLITNSDDVYSVSEDATAAEDIVNLTLIYVIRVCPNSCASPYNCPTSVQFKLGDVATGVTPAPSTSNLIIERAF